jgi:hypothetical protein
LFLFRIKSKPKLRPRIIGFDDTFVIIDWNEKDISRSVEIVELPTGDLKHELHLNQEFKNIYEAKISHGRMGVLGCSLRSNQMDVIVLDLKTKTILLRCSEAVHILGSNFFILHKDKILFLGDNLNFRTPREKFIYSAKYWI